MNLASIPRRMHGYSTTTATADNLHNDDAPVVSNTCFRQVVQGVRRRTAKRQARSITANRARAHKCNRPQCSTVKLHVNCLNCGTIQNIEPTEVGALCVRCIDKARSLGIAL